MAEESMKVVIGADVTGAVNAMNILSAQVTRLQKLLALPNLSFKQYERLNEMLRKTQTEFNRVQTASKSLAGGTNSAAFALQNLGRVAQDVPFGFIGIANNLNPLIESFQRLRVETGSNKAALAALGSSLMGAGGIGLALSAVTAIISFATMGFGAWTRGMGKSKKETEENAKAIQVATLHYDEFEKKLRELTATAAQEVAKVSILFGALADSNIKLEERKSIINQLNAISGKYLGHLDAEKSSYIEISQAVEDYLKNIATATELKALLPEFEGIIQKMVAAQVELNQLKRQKTISEGLGLWSKKDEADFREEETKLNKFIKARISEIKVAKKSLEGIAGSGLALEELLFGKKDQALNKTREVRDTLEEELKALFRTSTIIAPTGEQTIFHRMLNGILDSWDEFKEKLKAPKDVVLPIKEIILDPLALAEKEIADRLESFNKAIGEKLTQIRLRAFETLGESIGTALAGGNPFAAFLNLLADSAIELGKIAIATGAAMEAIKAAFKSFGGVGAIAAGVALIALGTFVKAKVAKIPKFAEGGIVTKPTLLMAGEAGPEAILNKNQMQALFGANGNAGGEVRFRIRGKDLVGVLDKGNRSLNSIT